MDWGELSSYAAGLLDGDGYVMERSIGVAMVNLEPLELLRSAWGGRIRLVHYTSTGKPYYEWYICGDAMREFAESIFPKVHIPEKKAKLAKILTWRVECQKS